MIQFMWPLALILLPLPVLARFLLPAKKNTKNHKTALTVPFLNRLKALNAATIIPVRKIARIALIFCWLFAVFAAARPFLPDTAPRPLLQSGRNILLAIDASGSMSETDIAPDNKPGTRFDIVKEIVTDFIRRRTGDNLGLVLFGSEAYTFVPLSFDTETTAALFGEAGIGIAGEMTAIGDAIALGVKNLISTPADSRVLILLSDGHNNAGNIRVADAVKLAADEKIKIHTVGIGADKQLINTFFGNAIVNPSADLDEDALKQIALQTGGGYFRARSSADLIEVYKDLDKIEPAPVAARTVHPSAELFHIPLLLSLFFLFIAWHERRRR